MARWAEKSFAFESAFHAYCRRYLAPEIHYFSGLMHLWEIQIVERFARHPKYFPVLLSCNKPVAQSWCRRCPKCAVTYLLLSAFVDPAEVQAIFGEELFARAELEPAFQAILGVVGDKPLECVCTPEEAVLAARRAAQRIAAAGAPLPGLLARALAGTAAVVIDEAARANPLDAFGWGARAPALGSAYAAIADDSAAGFSGFSSEPAGMRTSMRS